MWFVIKRYLTVLFSVATVTNYHKFSGLKQHRFILLLFWVPELQNESYRAKIKMSAGLISSGGFRRGSESIYLVLHPLHLMQYQAQMDS